MKHNPPALVLIDRDGVVRHWDERARALFGYAAHDTVGKSMEFLINPVFHERHWKGFGAAMARAQADPEQPVANAPITCADGTVRHFPLRFVTVADPFGRPAGMLAVFHDPAPPGEPNGLFDLYPEALEA